MSMAVGIGLWLTKWAATNAAKAALESVLSTSVQKEIDKVIKDWAGELPKEAYVHPSSLNLNPEQAPSGLDSLEALQRLGKTFAEGRLPHRQQWLAALVEQREQLRRVFEAAGQEPQAYYQLEPEAAQPFLEDLAARIDLKCRDQETLFRTHTSQQVDSIQEQLGALAPVIQLLADSVNDDIADAFEFTKNGQPDVTLVQLDRLRGKKWGSLNGHTRYRLLANRGTALYALGKPEEAAREYLAAHSHDPEDRDARALEALAYMFLENHERAYELAEALCAEHPTVQKAHTVRIRTAPAGRSLDDLEDSVPVPLREDPEILMALFQRAMEEGLEDRAEAHARRACEASPDWADAQLTLASTLLQRVILRVGYPIGPDSIPDLSEAEATAANEARDVLTALLDRLGDRWKHSRAMAHFNRAGASGLLGDWAARLRDLHDAQRIEGNPEHALALGMSLDAAGDLDSAIRVFREQCERAGSRRLRLLLAMSLRDRNGSGDLAAALQVLKSDSASDPDEGSITRVDVVQLHASLLFDTEGPESAARYLDGLADGQAHPLLPGLLRAEILLKQGQRDEARDLVLKCFEARDGAEAPALRLLARALQRVGEPAKALPIWESLAGTGPGLSPELFELLRCARQAGSDGVVRDRCREIREAGVWARDVANLEIDTLLKYQEYQEALPLLQDFLVRCPSDVYTRLNLSILGRQLDRPDLVDTNPDSYPPAKSVRPELGRAIACILATGAHGDAALRYAYELVRQHPDSAEANQAIIALCLPGLGSKSIVTPKPTTASPGAAVELQLTGGRPARWVVIEDDEDPPPAASRNEFAVDAPVSQALLGKQVGDEVDIPLSFATVKARIARITSKFDYRAMVSLSAFETQFPEASFVTRFRVPDPPPSGPKTLRDVLGDEAMELLSRSEQSRTETKQLYLKYTVPIASLVGLSSETYLEVHELLAEASDIELRCAQPQVEELASASAQVSAEALVLDESALATLLFIDRASVLSSLGNCLVPEAFLLQLRAWLEANPPTKGERLAVGAEGGEPKLTRISSEVVAAHRQSVEALLSALDEFCTPFGGGDLAYFQASDRRWLDELSPGTAHALAVASRRGLPLWTDDFAVGSLGREIGVTERTWTQALFFGLRSRDAVTQADVDEVSARLLALGYRFTGMSPSAVVFALRAVDWNFDREPGASALSHFKESMEPRVLLGFLAGVLRLVWSEAPETTRVPITIRALENVSTQPSARRLLFRLARDTEQVFRFEPILAARIRSVIETWLGGAQRGSSLILPPTPAQLLALASSGSRCPRCGSDSLVIVLKVGGQTLVCCERCRPA